MSDGVTEQVKKFLFKSLINRGGESEVESLEVFIPEQLQASYSFYTWPSAPVLAWFLWEHRRELPGKHILELGSGTALPGIVAAKCGAAVTLTDSANLPKSLQHVKHCCEVNGLLPSQFRVLGLTWGLFLSSIFTLGPVDLILGSDCFYEPSLFEDIIVTVAYLLEKNPQARFLCSYQERSADWSIEHLLHKWHLQCEHIPLNNLGAGSGIDINTLMQDHTIHLLEITRI
ncbi:histone-arginine methyltransferase METTL23 [Anabrus simplex]|uniref:histone-arginine methyltransferase METTL23 n=1 Tax=Anabrus simplex TaxID=316456 RepID=UPI0034DCE2BC